VKSALNKRTTTEFIFRSLHTNLIYRKGRIIDAYTGYELFLPSPERSNYLDPNPMEGYEVE